MYEAGIGFFWGLGTIVGPLIGGALAEISAYGWRWSFWILTICGALELVGVAAFFPDYNPKKEETTIQKLAYVDWLGATLMAAWFAFFVSVLSIAGTTFTWGSGASIAVRFILSVADINPTHHLPALGRMGSRDHRFHRSARFMLSDHKRTPHLPRRLPHEQDNHVSIYLYLRHWKRTVDRHLLHAFVSAIHQG